MTQTGKLTDRQRQAYDFIVAMLDENGYPPTLREIGNHMGIRSTNGVNDHLKALERKGYISREELKSRSITILRRLPRSRAEAQRQTCIELLGQLPDDELIRAESVLRSLVALFGKSGSAECVGDLPDGISASPHDG